MSAPEPRTPGQLIQQLLDERGWSQQVLAAILEMEKSKISRLLADRRPLDADMAVLLEEVFAVSAERFMELQKRLEIAQARIIAQPDPARSIRAAIFGDLPVPEMIKRGWIHAESVRDTDRIQAELLRFFAVNRLDDIEVMPHAAKKTVVNTAATPAQIAWLYRVRQIASEMLVATFSDTALTTALARLKSLLGSPEEARKVPRIMAEAGVRFLLVETLPGAKIDGVCLWLGPRKPVIALTARFDRMDNFWFVLRHEIEHVLQGHGQSAIMLDAELEGARAGDGPEVADEERVANIAAAEFLVPKKLMQSFVARKAPFFPERDVLALANMAKVHPSLVAGQLRHVTGRYDRFANLLTKIRSYVAPSAVVDGWGDIYPVETNLKGSLAP